MSQRKNLLGVSFHTEDNSGMYSVGEIDVMTNVEEIEAYIKQYGRPGVDDILLALNHQIWFVLHTYYSQPFDGENMNRKD